MKILMSNLPKTYGLIVPDEEKITVVGLFNIGLLLRSVQYCSTLFALEDDGNGQNTSIRVAVMEKNGNKSLVIQPRNFTGDAWIAVAPLFTTEEES